MILCCMRIVPYKIMISRISSWIKKEEMLGLNPGRQEVFFNVKKEKDGIHITPLYNFTKFLLQ